MYLVPVFQVADLTLAKLFFDDGDGLNGAVAFGECPTYIAPEVLRSTMHPRTAPADNKGESAVLLHFRRKPFDTSHKFDNALHKIIVDYFS